MSFCYQLADILNLLLFKADTWVIINSVDVALWIGNPTADLTGGLEVSGSNYSRVNVLPAGWTGSLNGSLSNAASITFPEASAPWGTVTHVVLFMEIGVSMFFGPLETPKEIGTGSIPKFATGDLDVALL